MRTSARAVIEETSRLFRFRTQRKGFGFLAYLGILEVYVVFIFLVEQWVILRIANFSPNTEAYLHAYSYVFSESSNYRLLRYILLLGIGSDFIGKSIRFITVQLT